MRLGLAGGELVDQPGRMEAEIVVELDPDGDGGVGGDVAVRLRLVDHDARGLVLEHPGVVADGIAVLEPFGVLEREPEGHVVLDREAGLERRPAGVEGDGLLAGLIAQVQLGPRPAACWPGLRARSGSPRGRGTRSGPAPGSAGRCRCTAGETRRTVRRLRAGGGTTLTSTSRIELAVVAAGDREAERLVDGLEPAAELAPLRGPERLDDLLAVGEAVGDPGRRPGPGRRAGPSPPG